MGLLLRQGRRPSGHYSRKNNRSSFHGGTLSFPSRRGQADRLYCIAKLPRVVLSALPCGPRFALIGQEQKAVIGPKKSRLVRIAEKITAREVTMRFSKALAVAAFATILSVGTAAAQTEIKFGHVGAPGSLFDQSATEFAKRANAKLGNKAKVVVYGSSQLGGDGAMLKKLKLGTIDLALPSTVMSSQVPEFGLFEMPYLVKNREHMAKIRDQIVVPILEPIALKHGYRIIGVWENGFRQITNNKRPINKPEDLKGINLRTPKGTWRVKMFKAYGANPTPLAFSEVFVALQTGVMDGEENPLAQIYPARFYEVQKYLSLTGHVYTPAYVTAGASWSRLSPDVQKILSDTAKEMQPVVYKIAAKLDKDLLQKLKDAGMKVNVADKTAFIKASKPIYDEFAKEVKGGKELIDKSLALGN
jgi:tripartite ATP-independent transporter DctP family solute receptor